MVKKSKNRYETLTYEVAKTLRAKGCSMQDIADHFGYDRAYLVGWYAGKTKAANARAKMIREAETSAYDVMAEPLSRAEVDAIEAARNNDGFWTARFITEPTCESAPPVGGSASLPEASNSPETIDHTILSLIWTGYLQRSALLGENRYLTKNDVQAMLGYVGQIKHPAP